MDSCYLVNKTSKSKARILLRTFQEAGNCALQVRQVNWLDYVSGSTELIGKLFIELKAHRANHDNRNICGCPIFLNPL